MTAEPAPPSGSSVKATRPSTATHPEALDGEGGEAGPEALDGEGGEAGAGLTLRSPRRRRTAAAHHNAFGNCGVPLAAGRGVLLMFNLVIYYRTYC